MPPRTPVQQTGVAVPPEGGLVMPPLDHLQQTGVVVPPEGG